MLSAANGFEYVVILLLICSLCPQLSRVVIILLLCTFAPLSRSVCRCVGVSVCRCVGPIGCVGVSVCRCVGVLVQLGVPVCWLVGSVGSVAGRLLKVVQHCARRR